MSDVKDDLAVEIVADAMQVRIDYIIYLK